MTIKSILEEALTNPQALLSLVSKYTIEMVFVKDMDNKLLYVSPSVEKILGYTQSEYSDQHDDIRIAESNHNKVAEKIRKEFIENDNTDSDNFPAYFQEVRAKNGKSVILETHERFITEEGERIAVVGIAVDVSDYMHQLEELQGNNQGLMVIHHTQKMLMDLKERESLLTAALEASLSMLGFDKGVVYNLDLKTMKGTHLVSRGVSGSLLNQIRTFPLSEQAGDGTIDLQRKTAALVFPPGHSWLEPLKPLGDEVVGLAFVANNKPDALIVVSCSHKFGRETLRLVQAIGSLVSHSMENAYLHDTIESLSTTDALTGLHNRKYADNFLNREDKVISRYKRTASLLLVKIAKERQVSEEEENTVITRVSQLVQSRIRATDMLSRYDKDEFLLYLPETDSKGLTMLIDRLKDSMLKTNENDIYQSAGFRVYFGRSSSFEGDQDIEILLNHARTDLEYNMERD